MDEIKQLLTKMNDRLEQIEKKVDFLHQAFNDLDYNVHERFNQLESDVQAEFEKFKKDKDQLAELDEIFGSKKKEG